MGDTYSDEMILEALLASDGDVDRACDWLASSAQPAAEPTTKPSSPPSHGAKSAPVSQQQQR